MASRKCVRIGSWVGERDGRGSHRTIVVRRNSNSQIGIYVFRFLLCFAYLHRAVVASAAAVATPAVGGHFSVFVVFAPATSIRSHKTAFDRQISLLSHSSELRIVRNIRRCNCKNTHRCVVTRRWVLTETHTHTQTHTPCTWQPLVGYVSSSSCTEFSCIRHNRHGMP